MDRCSVWSAVTRVRPKHVTMSRHITPHHHNARLRSNDININMTATEMSCSLTQMTSQCWRLCDDSWSLWPVLTRSGWLPIYHLSAEASNDGPSWRYLLTNKEYLSISSYDIFCCMALHITDSMRVIYMFRRATYHVGRIFDHECTMRDLLTRKNSDFLLGAIARYR